MDSIDAQFRELIERNPRVPSDPAIIRQRAARRHKRSKRFGIGASVLVLAGALATGLTLSAGGPTAGPAATKSKVAPHSHPGAILSSVVAAAPTVQGVPLGGNGLILVGGTNWLFTSNSVYIGAAAAAPTRLTAIPGSVTAGEGIVAGTAIDAQHAWVATQPTSGTGNVTIDSTVNGGASWQSSTVAGSEKTGTPSIEFSDASDGFLVVPMGGATPGSTSALFRTTDGGLAWSEVSSSVPVGPVSQTSTTTLWGDAASGGNLLFESFDAGASWQRVTLPAAPAALAGWTASPGLPESIGGTVVLPISYMSPSDASVTLVIFRSSNGGASWTATSPIADPQMNNAPDVPTSYVSASDWVVTTGDAIYQTSNAGGSWDRIGYTTTAGSIGAATINSAGTGTALLGSSTCRTAASASTSCTYATSIITTSDDGVQWVPAASGQTTKSPFSP